MSNLSKFMITSPCFETGSGYLLPSPYPCANILYHTQDLLQKEYIAKMVCYSICQDNGRFCVGSRILDSYKVNNTFLYGERYFSSTIHWELTLCKKPMNCSTPEQNGWHLADNILDTFSWMEIFLFWLKFYWSLFLIDNNPASVWIMAWPRIGSPTSRNQVVLKPEYLAMVRRMIWLIMPRLCALPSHKYRWAFRVYDNQVIGFIEEWFRLFVFWKLTDNSYLFSCFVNSARRGQQIFWK